MFYARNLIRLLAVVIVFLASVAARQVGAQAVAVADPATIEAAAPAWGEKWVRLTRDKRDTPLSLEVAVVRYVPAGRAKRQAGRAQEYVDLIAAVHIGDRRYYATLNRRFRSYDALLYELVAPEGTVVERGRGTSNLHPLGALQNGMKSMLEIEHQLEQVDYTRPNFVHADFSPAEFAQSMKDRDEGWMQLYWRMMGQAMAQQSQQAAKGESADLDLSADLFAALVSDDRPRMLKIALAKQFESMEAVLLGIGGPNGSTLITERNKRALEVLRQQQAAGRRKIGIFYGAGHLTDMHERLVRDHGLKPASITWLEAWDLREK